MNEADAQSGNVYLMTFVCGVLSVVTFGLVPSMLHRMGEPRVHVGGIDSRYAG